MSLVLGQLLQQRCSIYRTTVADEYGNGPRRVAVVEHALCRLNERGESRFEKNAGGAVITGSARCWLDGDVPVRKGDVVVDDDTHNEFIPELLRGLAAVHEVATLDHVSRLGLRYLDAVLPRAGESVEQYLVGGLHGIEFSATQRYRLTESVFGTDTGPLVQTGTLVTRVHRMTAPLGFPPDMQPNGLMINPKFEVKEPRAHAVIDTDHFVEGRMPIDMDNLGKQVLSLHATIKSVFGATTTDHARNAWA